MFIITWAKAELSMFNEILLADFHYGDYKMIEDVRLVLTPGKIKKILKYL